MPLFSRTRPTPRATVGDQVPPQDANGAEGAAQEAAQRSVAQGAAQEGLSRVLLAELRGQREDFKQTYALIESRLEKLEKAMRIKPKASVSTSITPDVS